MAKTRLHIFVYGRVQGIGYRGYVRRIANKIGVAGWVRNLHDGRVEAVVEGEEDKVNYFVELCKRGPPFARVDKVEVLTEPYKSEFFYFKVSH